MGELKPMGAIKQLTEPRKENSKAALVPTQGSQGLTSANFLQ